MKTRFSTIDIAAVVFEINERFLGMRVVNIYDIDNKTYLIKLAKPDLKAVLLLESGIRLHGTEFDWPKSMSPSGFAMKLRKHLRARRLESVTQLGVDRIVDLQFGSGEAAYHVILELYDRGNIILTDYEYTILNILRPRTDDSQDVKYAVRETYPIEAARQPDPPLTIERLRGMLLSGQEGDPVKKILNPKLVYGPALIEHSLTSAGLAENVKLGKGFDIGQDLPKLMVALEDAEKLFQQMKDSVSRGFITQKKDKKVNPQEGEFAELLTYDEFHPYLFKQYENKSFVELPSFNKAVDEFYSKIESQKLDMKVLQKEKVVVKKLENVKKDHEKRLETLQKEQEQDIRKAELIEINLDLVDRAILVVQSAVANQIDWDEIKDLVKEAQLQGDPVAIAIKALKLDTNHITMLLSNPYAIPDSDEEEEDEESSENLKPLKVDIDLGLTAYANARKYYDMKRFAAHKEQKTIDASAKALKSAERKTKQTLKEVATLASINRTRKTAWFEKFLYFISSENYLVIGGRDQQQNELLVKRYLTAGDIYVHADLHGASSVVIKNPTGEPVPPKTLNEAGTMAVCNSAAWDAKVVTSAWWVYHDQVSKTAPTGEYLTTGSFMIRGKKNYVPPCYLIYGFGFLFKLEEGSVYRHQGERKAHGADDEDTASMTDSMVSIDGDTASLNNGSDSEMMESDTTECYSSTTDCYSSSEKLALLGTKKQGDSGVQKKSEDSQDKEAPALNSPDGVNFKAEGVAPETVGQESSSSSSSEEESAYPDTQIDLKHIRGEMFQSTQGRGSSTSDKDESDIGHIEQVERKGSSRLTAKQRRELKKKSKQTSEAPVEDESDRLIAEMDDLLKSEKQRHKQQKQQQAEEERPQPKRGQKAKMKKIKEKYKDQDEEERRLRMELLASAGEPKEEKKKDKKGGHQHQMNKQKQRQLQKQQPVIKQQHQHQEVPQGDPQATQDMDQAKRHHKALEEEEQVTAEEKAVLEEENVQILEDVSAIDTLTGCPVVEDELLYAIPVCAPYTAIVNYKYKVKLTPGTQKRGKAVQTALNMFLHEKTATPRERELLRVVKDNDLSRNMPGKVKVSAPNLQTAKRKR
ncbi:nuclear export mediator factor Nemf [Lingula anatina]|uniref:Nuclear export mediator factor Nemf n=1 Tax=Lingula anatina TaxID=7574 RepID=A0A1S3IJN0_LINAN|nr:nuclear export mediator factor Nemf [Lingula anatina]|eukprot:XP_013398422.1 nuclear export mediator factor Nemf [Lingula anatina]